MNRVILLLFVVAIVGAGLFAGVAGLLVGGRGGPNPSQYVTINGNCFVKPQGDPLYDQHYAQEVNPYNCDAYYTQEQANRAKAETRQINVETTQGITLVYTIFAVVGLLLVAAVAIIIRGQ